MSKQKSSSENQSTYVELCGSFVSMEGLEVLTMFEKLPIESRKKLYKTLVSYNEMLKIKSEKTT